MFQLTIVSSSAAAEAALAGAGATSGWPTAARHRESVCESERSNGVSQETPSAGGENGDGAGTSRCAPVQPASSRRETSSDTSRRRLPRSEYKRTRFFGRRYGWVSADEVPPVANSRSVSPFIRTHRP